MGLYASSRKICVLFAALCVCACCVSASDIDNTVAESVIDSEASSIETIPDEENTGAQDDNLDASASPTEYEMETAAVAAIENIDHNITFCCYAVIAFIGLLSGLLAAGFALRFLHD